MKDFAKTLLTKIGPLQKEKIIWVLFLIAGLVIWLFKGPSDTEIPIQKQEGTTQVDTFIPKDHILVPIELENKDQLQELIGSHGVVDLYQVKTPLQKGALVGRRLRILRAPLNPTVFAVLIREKESDRIFSFPGPFRATLRNPEQSAHEISTPHRRFQIETPEEGT